MYKVYLFLEFWTQQVIETVALKFYHVKIYYSRERERERDLRSTQKIVENTLLTIFFFFL